MSVVVVNDGLGDGVRYYLIERLSIYHQVAVDLDRSIKTCGEPRRAFCDQSCAKLTGGGNAGALLRKIPQRQSRHYCARQIPR